MTDVQLKYTKDGKFRQFAFVGYKTEEQAQLAQSYFNQTYVDTNKISVEQCANLGTYKQKYYHNKSIPFFISTNICNISGEASKPRAWSKYAPDSSYNKVNKTSNAKSKETLTNSLEKSSVKSGETDKKKEKKKTEEEDNEEVKKALEKV